MQITVNNTPRGVWQERYTRKTKRKRGAWLKFKLNLEKPAIKRSFFNKKSTEDVINSKGG